MRQFSSFYYGDLQTTAGENLKIINPGLFNENVGPDFFHSKVEIGDTSWAGNVDSF